VRVATIAVTALLALASPAFGARVVSVSQNHLVDGNGKPMRLLGADRSGTEYACAQGWGFTDSPDVGQPDSKALIGAMSTWGITAVRVPLNEACWLGINGVPAQWGGANYRSRVATYVHRLEAAGMNPILDLHVADPGDYPAAESANGLRPVPDRLHALPFWRQVAREYGNDRRVVFDLYNEPNDTTWRCLRDGCLVTHDFYSGDVPHYKSVGTQDLVDAIRAQGAKNVIMVPGIDWTGDLSRWLRFRPSDPLRRVAASFHNYEDPLGSCHSACWNQTIAPVAKRFPVVTGEFGDTDCNHDYSDTYMKWADAHGVSYLGWTWDATSPGGWTCSGGPSLIRSYDGKPTNYGVGLRNHLRALGGGQSSSRRKSGTRVLCVSSKTSRRVYRRKPQRCTFHEHGQPVAEAFLVRTRHDHWHRWHRSHARGRGREVTSMGHTRPPVRIRLSHPVQRCGHRVFVKAHFFFPKVGRGSSMRLDACA
jgi:endoglucanase